VRGGAAITNILSGAPASGQDHYAEAALSLHLGEMRLITIEDAAALQLSTPPVARRRHGRPTSRAGLDTPSRAVSKRAACMLGLLERIILRRVSAAREPSTCWQAITPRHEGSMRPFRRQHPRRAILVVSASYWHGLDTDTIASVRGQNRLRWSAQSCSYRSFTTDSQRLTRLAESPESSRVDSLPWSAT